MIDENKYHGIVFWDHFKGGEWRRVWTSEPFETLNEAYEAVNKHWASKSYSGTGYGKLVLNQRNHIRMPD